MRKGMKKAEEGLGFPAWPGSPFPSGGRPVAGFTLIELIIAIGIFLAMGSFIYTFISTGLRIWEEGEGKGAAYEAVQGVIEEMTDDLRSVYTGEPLDRHRFKFLCDTGNAGEEGIVPVPRLRFVRTLKGEMKNPITREAGTLPGSTGTYDLFQDAEEAQEEGLLPPGGLAEVLYTFDYPKGSEGVGVLRKGIRAPLGGEESFFGEEIFTQAERLSKSTHPLIEGVLYGAFLFERGDGPSAEKALYDTWDSTRGILGEGPLAFPLFKGQNSLNDPRDDIFPKRVEVILVFQEEQNVQARLLEDLDPQDLVVPVHPIDQFPTSKVEQLFVKIDEEWISYQGKDASRLTLLKRGARGTRPSSHRRGAFVRFGRTFSFAVRIPCYRECWNGL